MGTKIEITVKPNSSQEKIEATGENALTIYLRSKPHDGAANADLIKLLSKYYKVPKTTIKILRGAKSRKKLVEL